MYNGMYDYKLVQQCPRCAKLVTRGPASARRGWTWQHSDGAVCGFVLADLYSRSLADVNTMLCSGEISKEVYADYIQLWTRGAPRFSNPYVYREDDVPRPNVVEPLAASVVARFLSYLARDVLFLG